MRAFIAIELPPEIKNSLAELQNQLKSSGADVKWVKPDNIHLTLKFLGEIDQSKLDKISKILEDISREKKSFPLRLASVGAFPKINYPRVIWAGIDAGDSETKEIAKELEAEIAKVGIPKEDRPFSSHITIGRTRTTLNQEKLVQILKILEHNLGNKKWEFMVTKITLFKSTLTPKGPIYEVLKETHLNAT